MNNDTKAAKVIAKKQTHGDPDTIKYFFTFIRPVGERTWTSLSGGASGQLPFSLSLAEALKRTGRLDPTKKYEILIRDITLPA